MTELMTELLQEPVDRWADEGEMAPGGDETKDDPLFEAWPTAEPQPVESQSAESRSVESRSVEA